MILASKCTTIKFAYFLALYDWNYTICVYFTQHWVLSTSLCIAIVCSFPLLYNMPLHEHNTICSTVSGQLRLFPVCSCHEFGGKNIHIYILVFISTHFFWGYVQKWNNYWVVGFPYFQFY